MRRLRTHAGSSGAASVWSVSSSIIAAISIIAMPHFAGCIADAGELWSVVEPSALGTCWPADAASDCCLPFGPRENNGIPRIGRPAEALGDLCLLLELNATVRISKTRGSQIGPDHRIVR